MTRRARAQGLRLAFPSQDSRWSLAIHDLATSLTRPHSRAGRRPAAHRPVGAQPCHGAVDVHLAPWRVRLGHSGRPVTIAYQVVQEQGFVWRLVMTQHLKTGIGVAMLVFPLCGYLFGRYLWTTGEENYGRMVDQQTGRNERIDTRP